MQNYYSDSKKRNIDIKINILILQMVFVAIILIAAFVLRIFGGEIYTEISTWYRESFNEITTADEVLNADNSEHIEAVKPNDTAEIIEESFEEDLFSEECGVDDSVKGYLSKEETDSFNTTAVSNVNSLIWPVNGKVTSEYGYRIHPITGKNAMHGGIDIGADKGTPINSVFDGKISKKGYSNSYGYYVIISHSDSFETLYAHCSKLLANEGDEVKKGDTVALVGSTGRSTGPHLHFEIRLGGCRVDPRWLLCEALDV